MKATEATDATDDTPMVLTATEKGRVIAHGEEPSLEEAAADRKKFVQLFGHLYPFGVEKVFHVHIRKMMSAKSYQVTRPLDDAGVALMKNYLIQTPPAWPHHNLCIMPKLNKGETWREGMTWDDIKDGQFLIINGQHSVAASRQIIAHKDTEQALKDKLKIWPCTIVWTDDPSMTVRLSYTLNNSNSFNKFTPTWTTQIMYCRRVWVKLGRPQKQRANAVSVSDPKMAEAWRVNLYSSTYLSIYLSIYPSIYPPIYPSIYLIIYWERKLPVDRLEVCTIPLTSIWEETSSRPTGSLHYPINISLGGNFQSTDWKFALSHYHLSGRGYFQSTDWKFSRTKPPHL